MKYWIDHTLSKHDTEHQYVCSGYVEGVELEPSTKPRMRSEDEAIEIGRLLANIEVREMGVEFNFVEAGSAYFKDRNNFHVLLTYEDYDDICNKIGGSREDFLGQKVMIFKARSKISGQVGYGLTEFDEKVYLLKSIK